MEKWKWEIEIICKCGKKFKAFVNKIPNTTANYYCSEACYDKYASTGSAHLKRWSCKPKGHKMKDRELSDLNKTILKKNKPEFCKGVFLAATLADDLGSDSRYRLSDRILLKLNLITKRQMRKKPVQVLAFDLKKRNMCFRTIAR